MNFTKLVLLWFCWIALTIVLAAVLPEFGGWFTGLRRIVLSTFTALVAIIVIVVVFNF